MGMFDTVCVTCPNCGETIKYQSKSGVCELKNYSQASVPPEVARGLDGKVETCGNCDVPVTLFLRQPIARVSMVTRLDSDPQQPEYD